MSTKSGTAKLEPAGTSVLGQLVDIDAKSISPETARTFLAISFGRSHQRRVKVLSQKAREGTLTAAELAELDDFIRVADLLAILKSKARQALKIAGLSA